MDLPKPPDEPELKNIIDKLANFVARNGPEFEQMTKQKQKNNPRFSFLFGGEHFNYYQYKVTTEQAIINQQKQKMAQQHISQIPQSLGVSGSPWPPNPQNLQQIQQLTQQLETHKKQAEDSMKQSEQNLAAQYQTMIQTQQLRIDEAIANVRDEKLQSLCDDTHLTRVDLNFMAQPIIDSCTKDAISNGKNWIFLHNQTRAHSDTIAQYLLKRILSKEATFELKLHLIYLINDVLHHCRRKNAEDLRLSLQSIVIPVFCSAYAALESDKQIKLNKLLTLWEQNKYFDSLTLEQLRDPNTALSTYQANVITEHAPIVTKITSEVNSRYNQLQQQHQDFVGHLQTQLQSFTQQIKSQLAALQTGPSSTTISYNIPGTSSVVVPPSVGLNSGPPSGIPSTSSQPSGISLPPPGVITQIPPVGGPLPRIGGAPPFPPPDFSHPPPNFSQPPPGFGPPPGGMPPSMTGGPPVPGGPPPSAFEYGHGQGPPVVQDYNHGKGVNSGPPPRMPLPIIPDFTKPPPGFPPGPPPNVSAPITDLDLTPSVPYHELPAGLMAPLVKLEDSDYEPIDPRDMRLPPPQPPSERLLAAVEAFYSPPSHDRPVDSEGWEKLGLFEFFKAKQKAKKMRETTRSIRRSPQRSRSESRSPSPRRRRRRSRSASPSPYQRRSRSRSQSPSPNRRERERDRESHRDRDRDRDRDIHRDRDRERDRSRNKERERSQSPPTFFSEPYYQSNTETKLGSENKGHQLLSKMGWGGGGLGATEQGIVDPIDHADVRERMDQYKGIGISVSDPFEQFRKGKSQGFIQRMRARDGNQ